MDRAMRKRVFEHADNKGPDQELHCLPAGSLDTDNPLYTDTRYNDKIRYNDNLTVTKPSLKR